MNQPIQKKIKMENEKTVKLKKISILGKICNVISVIFTMILCLPLPIVFLFLQKTKRNFSVYDSFKIYLEGDISIEALKSKNKNIIYGLIFLTVLFSIPIFILISGNTSNDFEIRGNYIFATIIYLMLSSCYYLCFEVNNYIKTV